LFIISIFIKLISLYSGSKFHAHPARRGAICLKYPIVPAIFQKLWLYRSDLKPDPGKGFTVQRSPFTAQSYTDKIQSNHEPGVSGSI
jgi:hypothetical protein